MTVEMLFFGPCADWMKRRQASVTLHAPSTVSAAISARPDLAGLLEKRHCLRVAVNRSFADFETEVRDGDEIAFLPPFSGG